jgi:hypothetical protein
VRIAVGRRRARFAAALALLAAGLLAVAPRAAGGQEPPLPDAIPTWWHEAAGLTPLLTAPPPPNPATICLIDTGVTPTPDLDITARWAYDGGTLDDVHATDETPGHGTLVAHFAAGAVNGWGGAGAFPHARISSVRVFPREGGASWREYIAAISRCLKLDADTKVIVISIGGQEIEPGEAEELEHWIERARNRHDVNVVVAAGNGGARPDFPARFRSAFTVTASAAGGVLCEFSAQGTEVDIAAPGCGLRQAGWTGEPWSVDGTSFAAPIVAGALAALRSYAPAMTARDAEAVLAATTRAGSRVDGAAAFQAAGLAGHLGLERGESTSGETSPASSGGRGAAARSDAPSSMAAGRALPRPRVVVIRRARGRVLLLVRNRPRRARVELALASRRIRRRADRIAIAARRGRARCRFATERSRSAWTAVRW